MKRGAFRLAVTFSTVLLVVAALLWIWSYFGRRHFALLHRPHDAWFVESAGGGLHLVRQQVITPSEVVLRRWDARLWQSAALETEVITIQAGADGQVASMAQTGSTVPHYSQPWSASRFSSRMTIARADGTWVQSTVAMDRYVIAGWLVVSLLAILPAIALVRYWRFRRPPGTCRVCGYDIRATPERCPECGSAPLASSR